MAQQSTYPQFSTGMGGTPLARKLTTSQAFWVLISIILISVGMTIAEGEIFATEQNFFNITRNFSFVAIMALGQTVVIITGGIDLGVGSVMGMAGITLGLFMAPAPAGYGWSFWDSALAALFVAGLAGLANGLLIAYLNLSPFVVTLGMLSIGRSLALAISNNKFFYQFGPDHKFLTDLGGGASLGIANSVWILLALTIIMAVVLRFTAWGRHVYAVGGNEHAARLTGISVNLIKISVYVLSSVMAGIAAILMVGWQGSVTNALGQNYELKVIASSVIGGVNLAGGEGGVIGAFIGAALIELIRNSLLLAGVDPYWQGTFVGLFIIGAVLLERVRGRKNN